MNEIVNVIQNASPVLAAVILGMLFKLRSQAKDIEAIRKRIDAYDQLHIEATLASIDTNIEFIKTRLLELTRGKTL